MAIVPTYTFPLAVVPTAVQAKEQVSFLIDCLAADTGPTAIPHNMAISAADLAAGFPIVVVEPLYVSGLGEAQLANFRVTAKAADSISLTKTNAVNSVGRLLMVHVLRPHSIGR